MKGPRWFLEASGALFVCAVLLASCANPTRYSNFFPPPPPGCDHPYCGSR